MVRLFEFVKKFGKSVAWCDGLSLILTAFASTATAQNPIVQSHFTPDPAPYALGDTVYLFTDHDENDAEYFKMKDWLLFSTTDMVNWTYRGTPMSTATFSWAKQGDNAWASQAICHEGKWYWYVAAEDTTKHLHGIGVAVADHAEGPYHDALGKPLIPGGWGYIDPSIFIDDDGTPWLFWGNNNCWYVKLKRDMIHLDGPIREVAGINDTTAFGPLKMKHDYQINKDTLKTHFEEGPWVFKRNGIYYLVYAAGGVPEHLDYSTAPTINGPWKWQGKIMGEAENSFTIHAGSIHFKGRDFMFYHNGKLPGGSGFRRFTAVEEFQWHGDSIPFIPQTEKGVTKAVRTLNPFQRIEGETMAFSQGITTDRHAGNQHYIIVKDSAAWLSMRNVDFKRGAKKFVISAASDMAGCSVTVHLDNLEGPIMAKCAITPSQQFSLNKCKVQSANGVHDIYLEFHKPSNATLQVDYEQFFAGNRQ
ncbi:MAG: glycoside hydrolase family 43 protein [Prevotella sp.]|jgi:hypothetical protein